jgi:phosphoribosylaminoimidazolecarboxamide formyltransferase/IMP cyclohydrolase
VKKIKTALVSVSNKKNLDVLADYLKSENIKVLSTGGTYKALVDLGVEVTKVSEQTGFPEVMDGRVKTLHPKIHMGLLARADHAEDAALLDSHGIAPFDLLVVNLYPFVEKKSSGLSDDELTEFVDVGGPSMIRAGAKGFSRLVTLTDPEDYALLKGGEVLELPVRRMLAGKAFKHICEYDQEVSSWLLNNETLKQSKELRYGENPHQKAKWIFDVEKPGVHQAQILQGKELSFNNLVDLTAAVESLALFEKPTVVSVKHNNPCGIGSGKTIDEALKVSLRADPMSVFGGIVALNKTLNENCARDIVDLFLECVIAPEISPEAKKILSEKKNLRVLEWKALGSGFRPFEDFKRVSGGEVTQVADFVESSFDSWIKVSGEDPDIKTREALEFSWKTVARLKSNAISVCGSDQSLGLGMGQVNRIDAVESALKRWKTFHPNHEGPVVLASDAFFPFADSLELIAKAGVKWVVQPGGSIKDKDVVSKAEELGVSMFFTGKRHFLH